MGHKEILPNFWSLSIKSPELYNFKNVICLNWVLQHEIRTNLDMHHTRSTKNPSLGRMWQPHPSLLTLRFADVSKKYLPEQQLKVLTEWPRGLFSLFVVIATIKARTSPAQRARAQAGRAPIIGLDYKLKKNLISACLLMKQTSSFWYAKDLFKY